MNYKKGSVFNNFKGWSTTILAVGPSQVKAETTTPAGKVIPKKAEGYFTNGKTTGSLTGNWNKKEFEEHLEKWGFGLVFENKNSNYDNMSAKDHRDAANKHKQMGAGNAVSKKQTEEKLKHLSMAYKHEKLAKEKENRLKEGKFIVYKNPNSKTTITAIRQTLDKFDYSPQELQTGWVDTSTIKIPEDFWSEEMDKKLKFIGLIKENKQKINEDNFVRGDVVSRLKKGFESSDSKIRGQAYVDYGDLIKRNKLSPEQIDSLNKSLNSYVNKSSIKEGIDSDLIKKGLRIKHNRTGVELIIEKDPIGGTVYMKVLENPDGRLTGTKVGDKQKTNISMLTKTDNYSVLNESKTNLKEGEGDIRSKVWKLLRTDTTLLSNLKELDKQSVLNLMEKSYDLGYRDYFIKNKI